MFRFMSPAARRHLRRSVPRTLPRTPRCLNVRLNHTNAEAGTGKDGPWATHLETYGPIFGTFLGAAGSMIYLSGGVGSLLPSHHKAILDERSGIQNSLAPKTGVTPFVGAVGEVANGDSTTETVIIDREALKAGMQQMRNLDDRRNDMMWGLRKKCKKQCDNAFAPCDILMTLKNTCDAECCPDLPVLKIGDKGTLAAVAKYEEDLDMFRFKLIFCHLQPKCKKECYQHEQPCQMMRSLECHHDKIKMKDTEGKEAARKESS